MKIVDGEEVYGIEDVKYPDEPYCEHCGDLEPHTPIADIDDVYYCLDCARYWMELSDLDKVEIDVKEVKTKIAYFKDRVKNLEEYLETLQS